MRSIADNINLKETIKVVPLVEVQNKLKEAYGIASEEFLKTSDEWDKPQNEEDANDTLLRMGAAVGIMELSENLSKWLDGKVVKNNNDNKKNLKVEHPADASIEEIAELICKALIGDKE